jgi:hypothetical protein
LGAGGINDAATKITGELSKESEQGIEVQGTSVSALCKS